MIETYPGDYAAVSGDDRAPLICIVGTNHLHYELITFCLVSELKARCAFHADLSAIDFSGMVTDRPRVLLLDCLDLDIADLEKNFGLYTTAFPDHIHVALFNVTPEVKLIRFVRQHKIRGIFYKDDSRHLFLKGIRTILGGRLWLSRKMLSDCIRMPLEEHDPSALSLKKLSNREKEILKSVASGDSNQEIANQLCISVHTVKTHLYKIYRKIDVPNRMRATLWLNACLLRLSAGTESKST
jgi:DNA-binding NarL/FixJ family response regulator